MACHLTLAELDILVAAAGRASFAARKAQEGRQGKNCVHILIFPQGGRIRPFTKLPKQAVTAISRPAPL
jgi:hypothetical protein